MRAPIDIGGIRRTKIFYKKIDNGLLGRECHTQIQRNQ